MKKSLADFLCFTSVEDFLVSFKNGEPLVIENLKGEHKELFDLPFLNSLEDLISFWPGKVNSYREGLKDEVNSRQGPKSEALSIFKNGHGLFFDDINRFSPIIDTWLQEIRKDLGLSELTYARSLVYAIAKGQGTAAHFDQNINFVLQIHGTKKWWLAKNEMVNNPLVRHTIGADMDPELATYINGEEIEEMPEDALEVELKPGSLLFVPQGYWHQTEALENSLALNFTYSAPSWMDLLLSFLRGQLIQSESWRETAILSDPNYLPLSALLEELKSNLSKTDALDILSLTEASELENQREDLK